jgi:hypothetical protein
MAPASGKKRRPTPEVTSVISSAEVTHSMLRPAGHVEVRQRRDGTWRVLYQDPGYIPCMHDCQVKHKHDRDSVSWIETNYTPTSKKDALDWAEQLAEGREVKVLPFKK